LAKRLLIIAFLCILAISSAANAAVRHLPGLILLAQNASDLDRKIAEYTDEIRRNPTGTMAYNERADAYIEKGYFDRAIADLSKLIELSPDYGQYYRMRGDAYRFAGDYDNAIADYDSWLAFAPNDVGGHHNRGLTYRLKGDYRHAIADFTFNVQRHPDLGMDLLERGATRILAGESSSAIADFGEVLRVNPRDWEAVLLRHFVGLRSGAAVQGLSPTVASAYERGKWPWPILAFLAGEATTAEVRAAAAAGSEADRRDHLCSAAFWLGENDLAKAKLDTAKLLFEEAVRRCPRPYFEYSLAKFELGRLEK
jgi:tetratricopeptide (TPR) repeat protein